MKNNEIIVSRQNQLINKVILINGFPGCGKTMLSPIIAAFKNVEIMQYPTLIEQICELDNIQSIDSDVAESMIKMNADLLLYNVMMGRQINCRPSDLSSIFKNHPLKYIKRMLGPGDETIPRIIELKNPVLHLTTHMQLSSSGLLFRALGDNLNFIEVVRHPFYMLIQMEKNFKLFSSSRNQHITYTYKEKEYPYFARGWEKRFDKANSFEKAIYSLNQYYSILFSKDYHDKVEIFPFEKFVKSPEAFMNIISDILDSEIDKNVKKEMSKQKVPRKFLNAGPSIEAYKKTGWIPPSESNERSELDVRRKFLSNNISEDALKCLDNISSVYEETFLDNFE
jgi:hypothetical protein